MFLLNSETINFPYLAAATVTESTSVRIRNLKHIMFFNIITTNFTLAILKDLLNRSR